MELLETCRHSWCHNDNFVSLSVNLLPLKHNLNSHQVGTGIGCDTARLTLELWEAEGFDFCLYWTSLSTLLIIILKKGPHFMLMHISWCFCVIVELSSVNVCRYSMMCFILITNTLSGSVTLTLCPLFCYLQSQFLCFFLLCTDENVVLTLFFLRKHLNNLEIKL